MKKYIWLSFIILFIVSCNGSIDYPLDIEYEVEGTDGFRFWGSYGDTLEVVSVGLNETVPTSLNFILYENEMAICNLSKHEEANENDTLIVSLYVDGDFFATGTTTTYNTITLCYPEYPGRPNPWGLGGNK